MKTAPAGAVEAIGLGRVPVRVTLMVRAVDHHGRKLTVMGDPVSWRRLLENGEARRRDGVMLSGAQLPVAVSGWLRGTEPRQARAGGYGSK